LLCVAENKIFWPEIAPGLVVPTSMVWLAGKFAPTSYTKDTSEVIVRLGTGVVGVVGSAREEIVLLFGILVRNAAGVGKWAGRECSCGYSVATPINPDTQKATQRIGESDFFTAH
jgi:hypothetical protein